MAMIVLQRPKSKEEQQFLPSCWKCSCWQNDSGQNTSVHRGSATQRHQLTLHREPLPTISVDTLYHK